MIDISGTAIRVSSCFADGPENSRQGSVMIDALVGHLVGDYLLQNDWMALNKKTRSLPCVVHCAIWTLSVCLLSQRWEWWFAAALFASHFVQDRTTVISRYMAIIGQAKFRDGICAPWSSIVVDNVWHILTIWALFKV